MTRDLTGKSAQLREIREIMAIPSMKSKLNSFIDEAVLSKQKIQYEQDHIKAIRDNAKEEVGIKPAVFNAYVAMVFNNDYTQRKDKLEELVDMVEAVMKENNLLPAPNDE